MGEWDGFVSEAREGSSFNPGGCGMGALLQEMSGEAADQIEAAMNRPDITSTAIHKALKARVDTNVSAVTLRRHRNNICSCKNRST